MPSSTRLGALAARLPAMALLFAFSSAAMSTEPCNLSKTNHSCTIVIDRGKPVAPTTIQMYSGQKLTVVVQHALLHERYFLDYATGAATIQPDSTSSVIQGLFPPLQALVVGHGFAPRIVVPGTPSTPPDPCADPIVTGQVTPSRGQLRNAIAPLRACLSSFVAKAKATYQALEPYVAPDSITPDSNAQAQMTTGALTRLESLIDAAIDNELAPSARITVLSGDDTYKAKPGEPAKQATATTPATKAKDPVPVDPGDAQAITELASLQKAADAIAGDLVGYRQRLSDLESSVALFDKHDRSVSLESRSDDPSVYQGMTSRTVTYSLDALNLVSNSQEAAPDPGKKRALASIVMVFADTEPGQTPASLGYRWEASAGVFFSTLPNRSYTVAPIYNGTAVTDNIVRMNDVRPTAVPFAAANYRLGGDLTWTRWKSNAYWTLAIGVNPNTKTADFAMGPSISWRALMVSLFAHLGHETRLSQGFSNGESLGASFTGTVPTDQHWTTSLALGFSVRVPALTGR